jgi:hypothetical protein
MSEISLVVIAASLIETEILPSSADFLDNVQSLGSHPDILDSINFISTYMYILQVLQISLCI